MLRCMPSRLKGQKAAVVDIGIFGRFQSSIQNESPINLMCSGNQFAMAIVEVETVVIHRFNFDVLVHDPKRWDEIESSRQMHHFLIYYYFCLSIWQLANQPNTPISGCERCDPIVSLHVPHIQRIFGVGDQHWSIAGGVSRLSAINEPITGWRIWATHHPIVLDRSGESRSSLNRCTCCSVGKLWRIAMLHAQAVLGDMPTLLTMNACLQILLFPIVVSHIISLIPAWTFAASTGFTAISTITTAANLLCKEQSFWSEPILSLDCSFYFDKLGDDLIGRGGHRGVFANQELQEDFPLVVPSDPPK